MVGYRLAGPGMERVGLLHGRMSVEERRDWVVDCRKLPCPIAGVMGVFDAWHMVG